MAATVGPPATRRFTSDEVWRMVEIGLLAEDEPYELLDGELVYVSPQGEPHAKAIARLTMLIAAEYGPRGYVVRVRSPIGGIPDSIPEPDLAVVTADVAEQDGPPRSEQTLLLVEVAATSQPRDRRKGAIYAAFGAPVYWIVDVAREVITVHTGPTPDGTWAEVREVGGGGSIALPGTTSEAHVAAILHAVR